MTIKINNGVLDLALVRTVVRELARGGARARVVPARSRRPRTHRPGSAGGPA